MPMRWLPIVFVLAIAGPANAQPDHAPPDFSGVWQRKWQIRFLLDPPPGGAGPIAQDPRYPKLDRGGVRDDLTDEERRRVIKFTPNWVPDLNNPILQPATREALGKIAAQEIAGIPHPELQMRCMPSGT